MIILITGKHPLLVKSGYAAYGRALASLLTKMNMRVHLFCVGQRSSIQKTHIGIIHTVNVPFLSVFKDRSMAACVPASIFLAYAINQLNTRSVVWGVGPWSLAGVFVKRKLLLADYFTTIRHEYGIPFFSPMEKYLVTHADKIITHYASTEEILRSEFGVTNFLRIPYAIDATPVKRGKNPKKILVTICRQDVRKGIPNLLSAYALLNMRGLEYKAFIVGTGSDLEKNKHIARDLHLSNVTFTGQVDDTSSYLKHAYAFVLPSLEEGSGSIAILEAMACGLPIVASDIDGIPEDVEDGKSCLLVPPGNPLALAEAMEKILRRPRFAQKLGQAAQTRFQSKYSENRVRMSVKKLLTSFGTGQ